MKPCTDPYDPGYTCGELSPLEIAEQWINGNRVDVVNDLRRYSDPVAAIGAVLLALDEMPHGDRESLRRGVLAVLGLD